MDPRLRLRHLTSFTAIARQRTLVGAAAELHVSQPALTRTLKEFEEIVGTTLFERGPRGLRLTEAGGLLLRHVGDGLARLAAGLDVSAGDGPGEIVRIGALPTVSVRLLPGAIAAFQRMAINLRPRIITGPNDYLLALLRAGTVDFVLGRMAEPQDIEGLSFEHLYSEELAFAVRPGHPLAARGRVTLADLRDFPSLYPPPGSVIRPVADRLLASSNIVPGDPRVESVSDSFGREFVGQTDAIWIISEGVVLADIARGLLSRLQIEVPESFGPVGLTTRNALQLAPHALALLDTIRQQGRVLGALERTRTSTSLNTRT